ncbi:hypothetical protein GQ53DRAFT_848344 [Thozetella sp. PMI_491]|nr:hypothetical protein GQ53DRAFT_848344 [Thozetella sp. PMI_491]
MGKHLAKEPRGPTLYAGCNKFFPEIHISLDSWWWRFLENHVYRMPQAPPRRRTKPMEVICVGLPRSGTESLQHALMLLGYDYTYHGWDIVYDSECHSPGWVRLARKKWYGDTTGDCSISAAEFDEILGHSVAVTDAAASVFAADMIAAYPDAKVILNTRKNVEAWQRSLDDTLIHANESWGFWIASLLDRECFWAWHVYERFLWPLLFRAPDGQMAKAIRRNAKWVAREHCNMIRGLVSRERLLEWDIEEGWEPLCKFLGKPVPDIDFPHANAASGGWKAREAQCNRRWVENAFVKLITMIALVLGGVFLARVWLP